MYLRCLPDPVRPDPWRGHAVAPVDAARRTAAGGVRPRAWFVPAAPRHPHRTRCVSPARSRADRARPLAAGPGRAPALPRLPGVRGVRRAALRAVGGHLRLRGALPLHGAQPGHRAPGRRVRRGPARPRPHRVPAPAYGARLLRPGPRPRLRAERRVTRRPERHAARPHPHPRAERGPRWRTTPSPPTSWRCSPTAAPTWKNTSTAWPSSSAPTG